MRRKLFKTTAALMLAGTVLFSSAGFSTLAASAVVQSEEESITTEDAQGQNSLTGSNIDLSQWESRAMGQSTDLNFQSTIHEDKIGVNQSDIVRGIQVKESDGTIIEKDAVVIESRGGKISNGHDGLTFFYTKLPVSTNFELETKVYLNQLGPWEFYTNGNKTTPSKQEAAGLMVRDAVSAARQNPMLEGYEELPACSNMVSTMLMANAKNLDTAINVVSYARNGVYSLSGNGQIQYGSTKIATLSERGGSGDVTDDLTPSDGIYNADDFFTLKLKKTDTEFITTYINSAGVETSQTVNDPGRIAVIDGEYMYVGLYAARHAKLTFTDINLTTTDGTLVDSTFVPSPYALSIENNSNAYAPIGSYPITFRTSYDGTADVYGDNVKIGDSVTVTAGETITIPYSISKETTDIKIIFTDIYNRNAETSFTVRSVDEKYTNRNLFISADGLSTAEGTLESPLDLATGLNYVSDGYTVYALSGTYGPLDILTTMSGQAGNKKTIRAYKDDEAVIFSGQSYLRASHWVLDNIKITGSTSAGLRVHGSYNLIVNSEFYGNEDTGLQLGLGSSTSNKLWPRNNTISYCYSHDNVDASGINADGFAAKLGIGPENLFAWCESAYNADDGWDIYNKVGDIPNDPITIRNCVAYGNGNNGFKLGGEGYPVDNVIEYCLAFKNKLDGFTCNFNTGELTVTNNTSYDNARYNYIFRYNPHRDPAASGKFVNNLSFRSTVQSTYSDYVYSTDRSSCYFFVNGTGSGITAADFVSTSIPSKMDRNDDLTFNYNGFMQPTVTSVLNKGSNSTFVGAVTPVKETVPEPPAEVPVSKVTLSKKTLSFDTIGASQTITATVAPSNAVNKTVTWSSSNKKVATVSKGKIKAIGNGSATITAKAGTKTATCKVTVSQKSKSVKLRLKGKNVGTALKVQKGKSYSFSAVVSPSNTAAKNAKITWSSSNKKIATVSKAGKVTIKGTGKVTLKAVTADKKSAKVTLNASKNTVKVTKVTVSGKKTMKVKAKQTLSFAISPLTAANQKVAWKSSNTKIAAVSTKGVVTAKKKGKVTITATAKDGSKKKAAIKISVTK